VEGRPLEETALVDRARRGDASAYEALVRRYQELAFRTAYAITGEAGEAEDAAQDALVKAFYALDRFRQGSPFRPWLLRIVGNEARNRRLAAGRRATLALRAGEDRPSGDAAPSPEAAALAREERAVLLRAVNSLREEDRLVIACRFFLDLSEAEMAAVLSCARGTVKSRLFRALGRLRGLLTEEAVAVSTQTCEPADERR
jgi:RNA polymerase sigma-70 factor (ECF subfamily)